MQDIASQLLATYALADDTVPQVAGFAQPLQVLLP